MAQSKSQFPVRRRISKACNYCRQRKIKCNGNSPCANCKNHSVECAYTKTVRRKKRKPAKKLTLQELEKRVLKLDEKFDIMNDNLTRVITILSQNNLVDKSLTDQIIHKDSVVSESGSMLSDDFSEEEYADDYSEIASDEDEGSNPISPITQQDALPNAPSRSIITKNLLRQSQSSSNILTPPDDEFQFMPRQQMGSYPLNSMDTSISSTYNLPQTLDSTTGLTMDVLNEQLNMMENKMMLSFDTVSQLGTHIHDSEVQMVSFP